MLTSVRQRPAQAHGHKMCLHLQATPAPHSTLLPTNSMAHHQKSIKTTTKVLSPEDRFNLLPCNFTLPPDSSSIEAPYKSDAETNDPLQNNF